MEQSQTLDTASDNHLIVNGERIPLAEAASLPAILADFGIDGESRGVAVAVNDEVVPRRAWSGVRLQAGDRVEVVTAKQGG